MGSQFRERNFDANKILGTEVYGGACNCQMIFIRRWNSGDVSATFFNAAISSVLILLARTFSRELCWLTWSRIN